jgi:DNA-binding transcriptional LysR family regulator
MSLRSCTVSYQDFEGVTHSVDVTAETLYEAAVLGMNALRVPRWHDNPNLKIQIRVRQPETVHDVWNSCLLAWLARNGKTPKEQTLKARLKELLRS